MNGLLILGIAMLGGVGAVLRWGVDSLISRWLKKPLGILLVNISGSLALGFVVGFLGDSTTSLLLGYGLLGGYTTFSSVAVTSATFADNQRYTSALTYSLGTLGGGVSGAIVGGWWAGLLG